MHADLIVEARQLVTCASGGKPKRGLAMRDVGIIENGAVAIADGKVVAVGKIKEIFNQFSYTDRAMGGVVCPGFVDPHTHIVYAGDRLDEFELKIKGADYLDILAAGGGILSTVRDTRHESHWFPGEFDDSCYRRLNRMLACGTTTCEIKTGYGLNTETELRMLEVIEHLDDKNWITPTGRDIVPTFLAAHAVPPEFKDNPNGYVDLICNEMLPRAWKWYEQSNFAAKRRPFFCDVFIEKNAFDLEQSRRVLETAKSLGFKIKAHVDQFTNLGGSKLGIEMGAVSIDHLDAISDEEITQLAASDTIGVVIPTENFSAGKTQFANARKLIDAGCAIALSTDYNPGSAPCPSQRMAMTIACRYQKLLPSEALNAATINAAHAIGLGETHGSIEVGKRADLVVFEYICKDYREIAYEFGGSSIWAVIVKGKVVFSVDHALK